VEWAAICTRLRADPNDQAAWSALESSVRGWARSRFRDLGDDSIEDIVADTCSCVVLDLDAAHGPATFRGFVLGKYLNAAKGVMKLASMPRAALDDAVNLPAAVTSDVFDQRLAVLGHCLERLPERDRRAVELRYFQGARAEQIARELRVSAVNARRIVFNGVNRLRKCAQAAAGPLAAGRSG